MHSVSVSRLDLCSVKICVMAVVNSGESSVYTKLSYFPLNEQMRLDWSTDEVGVEGVEEKPIEFLDSISSMSHQVVYSYLGLMSNKELPYDVYWNAEIGGPTANLAPALFNFIIFVCLLYLFSIHFLILI